MLLKEQLVFWGAVVVGATGFVGPQGVRPQTTTTPHYVSTRPMRAPSRNRAETSVSASSSSNEEATTTKTTAEANATAADPRGGAWGLREEFALADAIPRCTIEVRGQRHTLWRAVRASHAAFSRRKPAELRALADAASPPIKYGRDAVVLDDVEYLQGDVVVGRCADDGSLRIVRRALSALTGSSSSFEDLGLEYVVDADSGVVYEVGSRCAPTTTSAAKSEDIYIEEDGESSSSWREASDSSATWAAAAIDRSLLENRRSLYSEGPQEEGLPTDARGRLAAVLGVLLGLTALSGYSGGESSSYYAESTFTFTMRNEDGTITTRTARRDVEQRPGGGTRLTRRIVLIE